MVSDSSSVESISMVDNRFDFLVNNGGLCFIWQRNWFNWSSSQRCKKSGWHIDDDCGGGSFEWNLKTKIWKWIFCLH